MKIKALPTELSARDRKHMVRVSAETALAVVADSAYCGDESLPRDGYGRVVARETSDAYHGRDALSLRNIGDKYFLCSVDAAIGLWPELFDIEVQA